MGTITRLFWFRSMKIIAVETMASLGRAERQATSVTTCLAAHTLVQRHGLDGSMPNSPEKNSSLRDRVGDMSSASLTGARRHFTSWIEITSGNVLEAVGKRRVVQGSFIIDRKASRE
jgi:hypothetical protein